jgi:peptide/nickel transport system permease protein
MRVVHALGSRLLYAVLSLLLLSVLVFFAIRITGNPVQVMLPDDATPQQVAVLTRELGLNHPLVQQYLIFLDHLVHGNLGTSFRFGEPVASLIWTRLPATAELAGSALVLILILGVPAGIISAYRRGGAADGVIRGVAAVAQSAAPFWVGLLFIFFLSIKIRLLPSGGEGGVTHLILPALTLALPGIAGVTRLVRSSMIDALQSDYIAFHRIKGVPEWAVVWKHALRNAGLASLTYIGLIAATLLTTTLLVENIFVWPGVGQLVGQAITGRDFAVVEAILLLFATVYIVMNLLTDLLCLFLNPRLRVQA